MTHLCLVSEQPVPNLLPALESNPSIKPDRVVLAVSEKMRQKASFLEQALKARKIACEILDVNDPYNLPELQQTFTNWLDPRDGEVVMLNVTGGTKPMAIAAQEAFRMAGKRVFYVNIANDEIVWLDGFMPACRMEKSLPLKTYFQIHGYTVDAKRPDMPETWSAFGKELTGHATQWQQALAKLNWHAMQADLRDVLDEGRISDGGPHWDKMMEQLYYNEIIRDRTRLHFKSAKARAFANGGWIEWQVYETVRGLDGVSDPTMNLQIADAAGNKNELDVAFLCRNRLFIIECKTKHLDRNADDFHGPAAEAVYKLDALSKTGGIRTKGILVSFMPVGDNHKHRAEAAGITVIDQGGLPRLKELLSAAIK
jgi:hypothetical protein